MGVPVKEDAMYDWDARTEVAARRLERKHGQIVTLTDDQIFLMNGTEYRLQ
jgi:hypothetical protein